MIDKIIPFTRFPDPVISVLYKGKAYINTNMGAISSSRIEQIVFAYWIDFGSLRYEHGRLIPVNVKGSLISPQPTVYEKRVSRLSKIQWIFSPFSSNEINLVLTRFRSNIGELYSSIFILDKSLLGEQLAEYYNALTTAASNLGIILTSETLSFKYPKNKGFESSKEGEFSGYDQKCFKTLGLVPTKNAGLIRAAYRELAKQFHPDAVRDPNVSDERMKDINESYHHLLGKFDKGK